MKFGIYTIIESVIETATFFFSFNNLKKKISRKLILNYYYLNNLNLPQVVLRKIKLLNQNENKYLTLMQTDNHGFYRL